MSDPGKRQPSPAGARPSKFEAAQLGETALALPDGWIVQIEPNGQLAITPGVNAPYYTAAWYADPKLRCVRRRCLILPRSTR